MEQLKSSLKEKQDEIARLTSRTGQAMEAQRSNGNGNNGSGFHKKITITTTSLTAEVQKDVLEGWEHL